MFLYCYSDGITGCVGWTIDREKGIHHMLEMSRLTGKGRQPATHFLTDMGVCVNLFMKMKNNNPTFLSVVIFLDFLVILRIKVAFITFYLLS